MQYILEGSSTNNLSDLKVDDAKAVNVVATNTETHGYKCLDDSQIRDLSGDPPTAQVANMVFDDTKTLNFNDQINIRGFSQLSVWSATYTGADVNLTTITSTGVFSNQKLYYAVFSNMYICCIEWRHDPTSFASVVLKLVWTATNDPDDLWLTSEIPANNARTFYAMSSLDGHGSVIQFYQRLYDLTLVSEGGTPKTNIQITYTGQNTGVIDNKLLLIIYK